MYPHLLDLLSREHNLAEIFSGLYGSSKLDPAYWPHQYKLFNIPINTDLRSGSNQIYSIFIDRLSQITFILKSNREKRLVEESN